MNNDSNKTGSLVDNLKIPCCVFKSKETLDSEKDGSQDSE
jgi:hypothetical protein